MTAMGMKDLDGRVVTCTQSVCPSCLQRLPAVILERGGRIFMRKECRSHGVFEMAIWSKPESYRAWKAQSSHAPASLDAVVGGCDCPYSCGLCKGHEGDSCTAVFHLTDRCNMSCPVCFAAAGDQRGDEDLTLDQVKFMFEVCAEKTYAPTVQLSGGEPTLRDDLPCIIRMGKSAGIRHIQVNTNGLRLAEDPGYVRELADAGVDLIYMQFDGVDDTVYRRLRGRNLIIEKERAILNCARSGIGVLLVVTVYPGVNDHALGSIVAYAKTHMPTVKGIHLQPVTNMGRNAVRGDVDDAFTIPDVLAALEDQTGGEIMQTAIVARHKASAHCSFSSTFLLGDCGVLHPLTEGMQEYEVCHDGVDGFVVDSIEYANRFWRASSSVHKAKRQSQRCCPCGSDGDASIGSDNLSDALLDHTLTISGMHFQDAWNLDLDRLRGCCVHVVTPEGLSIPFCTYYLTSKDGTRLYGPHGLRADAAGRGVNR